MCAHVNTFNVVADDNRMSSSIIWMSEKDPTTTWLKIAIEIDVFAEQLSEIESQAQWVRKLIQFARACLFDFFQIITFFDDLAASDKSSQSLRLDIDIIERRHADEEDNFCT